LPQIETSSLHQDLYRRDFTVNAMAVSLNKDDFGYIVDYFGGGRTWSRAC
jgi:tRNA nucleotidyltransferase (CCA-adding enzyme)